MLMWCKNDRLKRYYTLACCALCVYTKRIQIVFGKSGTHSKSDNKTYSSNNNHTHIWEKRRKEVFFVCVRIPKKEEHEEESLESLKLFIFNMWMRIGSTDAFYNDNKIFE